MVTRDYDGSPDPMYVPQAPTLCDTGLGRVANRIGG